MTIQPLAPRSLAITLALLGAGGADEHHSPAVPAAVAKPPAQLRVDAPDESIAIQPSGYNLNAPRAEEPAMHSQQEVAADLYRRWASMWNGNLAIANDIIAEGFVAHLTGDALPLEEDVRDAASVARWVASIRRRGSNLSYIVELGPMVDGDFVVAYWRLTGVRQGPDGSSQQPFEKVGIDILRYRGNRVVECWTMNNNARR